jgi:phosphoribosylanthranilate isomerase
VLGALPGAVGGVVLSAESEPEAVVATARALEPTVLHLAGPPLGAAAVAAIRRAVAPTRVMQAIAVTGDDALASARAYERVADWLILDSADPAAVEVGGTGRVHDWDLSARIVEAVHVPVLLAGGLSPENVASAIRRVRPWGVDSFSHTNRPDDSGRKDPDRVRRFVEAAKGALG